ncbi:MAG: thiamine pyrophosphate-dependent enzyme [Candidatus Bipolaricaulia bacterium]
MALKLKVTDYQTEVHNDWCAGCGDFGILNSVHMTLTEMQLEPHRVAVFSGIGCSGKTTHYVNTYGVHTLHGRVLPYATGAKLANPQLKVIAVGGDGDGLGIGAGHFVSAGRRNLDITYIVFDNGVYGLTKGQASPTLKLGTQTKSLPQPNINNAVNSLLLALASGYTFIARGYAYDVRHLKDLIRQGIEHPGLTYINVLQPCPTYNNINTKAWYGGEDRLDEAGKPIPRVYRLEETDYNPLIETGMDEAEIEMKCGRFLSKATEWGNRIPIGVLLQNETASTYEQRISTRISNYLQRAPATRPIHDGDGRPMTDLGPFWEELRAG